MTSGDLVSQMETLLLPFQPWLYLEETGRGTYRASIGDDSGHGAPIDLSYPDNGGVNITFGHAAEVELSGEPSDLQWAVTLIGAVMAGGLHEWKRRRSSHYRIETAAGEELTSGSVYPNRLPVEKIDWPAYSTGVPPYQP